MSELKFARFEEIVPYLEKWGLTQSYILDFFDKLRKNNLEELFLEQVFSYKPLKEKHRANFIKALSVANDLDKRYNWAKDKWAFFGGMSVVGHLAKAIGIENAIKVKGCTDIDIVVDNSVLSPTNLKKDYRIEVGVIYPSEKFYCYDIDLTKAQDVLIYHVRIPIISLDDLIRLKKKAVQKSQRSRKHQRDLNLLERYVQNFFTQP